MGTDTLLNKPQTKLLKLASTYRTLVAVGYNATKALNEIVKGFSLDRTELKELITLLATKS
jgi:hypothetical protein